MNKTAHIFRLIQGALIVVLVAFIFLLIWSDYDFSLLCKITASLLITQWLCGVISEALEDDDDDNNEKFIGI